MRKTLYLLLVCVFIGHTTILNAQTNQNKSLAYILEIIQERFNVQFNYASDVVENITLETPDASLNLDQTLTFLSETTKLGFVPISSTTISIQEVELTFCGYIKDWQTKEPLPFVAVQAEGKGTYANEQGYFTLKGLHRQDRVLIRLMGYKPLQLELSQLDLSDCKPLYMIPFEQQLEGITVFDYLVRGLDKLDNGAYQLDLERFSTLPGLVDNDVLFAVQSLPGVQSVDETVSNINIRGGSNDQNLITWDGIKMYQSGHFFGLISMYNPAITNEVELRKNGSAAYETDGVSGTIAMKTKEELTNNFKGSVGANLIDVNGFIDLPIGKKASVQLALRKAISDFVESPTYASYFDRIAQETELENNSSFVEKSDFEFDFYDTSFRLLYLPSGKDRLKINFIHTANQVSFDETATIADTEVSRQSSIEQSSIGASLQYYKMWSDTWATDFAFYNTDYKLWAKNVSVLEDQRFMQENKVSESSLKLKLVNTISSRTNWTHGYQYIETKVTNLDDVDNPLYLSLEGEVLRTHALFSQIQLTSKNRATQLDMGMRFNYLTKFEKQLWEPRFGLNHRLNDYFSLELLGEFKHQNTSQVINFQNDFLGLEKRRWQLSNDDDVPVIKSKQASIGLLFNKNGWLLNTVWFYKQVDGITTQSQGFQDHNEFVQTSGSYDANGLDVLLRKQLRNNYIWLSYALLNSQYKFTELQEPSFANNFEIKHSVNVGANYHIGPVVLAAGINWHTGRPISTPAQESPVIEGEVNYNGTNKSNLPDYFRVDVSGKYEINKGEHTRWEIGAALWNILNKDNTLNVFYRTNGSDIAQRNELSALGITPNLSLKMTFL